jgi:hypothetical protein
VIRFQPHEASALTTYQSLLTVLFSFMNHSSPLPLADSFYILLLVHSENSQACRDKNTFHFLLRETFIRLIYLELTIAHSLEGIYIRFEYVEVYLHQMLGQRN